MFVNYEFYVGLRDIDSNFELKNTSLLSYLEDVGCMHSEIAGYGVTTLDTTRKTWVLLNWKVKLFSRPKINDKINIITWSRKSQKIYAFRDFKIEDDKGNLIGIAKSKWILIDIDLEKFVNIDEKILNSYEAENIEVDLPDFTRVREPKEIKYSKNITISKNMIDVNNHVHNIYYMDMAKNILNEFVKPSHQSNEFEICYKKEIKYGEKVISNYSFNKELGLHLVTIKSEDNSVLHATILLK